MAVPKVRLDVWKPKLYHNVYSSGSWTQTISQPARWVTCHTYENLSTNQRRKNAVTSVEIIDKVFEPRVAKVTLANRCQDFLNLTGTYTYAYKDSDGNTLPSPSNVVNLRMNWGTFTNFFYEFQHVRLVDLQTHMVLFAGRVYNVQKKYEDSMGSIVQIECKDVLEELSTLSCKDLAKAVKFTSTTRRSEMLQHILKQGLTYLSTGVRPAGGPEKIQESPSLTALSDTTLNINSSDAGTGNTSNTYSRFERSVKTLGHEVIWRPQDSGSRGLLTELARIAIAEPHADETAVDNFGYEFYVDPNIGVSNLSATVAPPPAMFNYFRRGNRLSINSLTNQDPEDYGLTVLFPKRQPGTAAYGPALGHIDSQKAMKVMQRGWDFFNPHKEKYTEAVLSYEPKLESGKSGMRDKRFEIIYVNYLTGRFIYDNRAFDDEMAPADDDDPGIDSSEWFNAYQSNGTTLIAAQVARIQHQAKAVQNDADFTRLMISDISSDFPTTNPTGNFVILKGATSAVTCKFNAVASEATEGRPSTVW